VWTHEKRKLKKEGRKRFGTEPYPVSSLFQPCQTNRSQRVTVPSLANHKTTHSKGENQSGNGLLRGSGIPEERRRTVGKSLAVKKPTCWGEDPANVSEEARENSKRTSDACPKRRKQANNCESMIKTTSQVLYVIECDKKIGWRRKTQRDLLAVASERQGPLR